MVKGIVGDASIIGHFKLLVSILNAEAWKDIWHELGLHCYTFEQLGLSLGAPDSQVWNTCQREGVILITDNRNEQGADSLEATIRSHNNFMSLPVFRPGSNQGNKRGL